ncbi:MAG: undecaprenyl-diphosphatase UppP [Actinobacteria bacterium]|uniref:Undecaprenyl-diphosphatase n=1 Tax=freshwater metagenome TaxID=449393 RepID=A0A6J6IY93_9ZZZZ|nr:undecaprenyl-diphosphatase UppP [Actinomycetota bacterium]
MSFFEALILGLVQGLTEFLPISSSAHVQIAQQLMNLSELSKPQLTAFIATIQLGTELAVVAYFIKDIGRIGSSWLRWSANPKSKMTSDTKLGWLIIIGTLPVVILGLAFRDFIENDVRNLWVIAYMLIGFGLLLGAADLLGKRQKTIKDLSYSHGVMFGIGQALALIPGVSRSGGTITVGLMLGYTREAAARYSFLLAIPAVLGSGLFQFFSSVGDLDQQLLTATIVATIVSGVVGLSVIHYLLKYLQKGSFLPFVIWRVLVGSWLLVMLSTGSIVA